MPELSGDLGSDVNVTRQSLSRPQLTKSNGVVADNAACMRTIEVSSLCVNVQPQE